MSDRSWVSAFVALGITAAITIGLTYRFGIAEPRTPETTLASPTDEPDAEPIDSPAPLATTAVRHAVQKTEPSATSAPVLDVGRLHALDSEWNVYLPNIDLSKAEQSVRALLTAADEGKPSAFRHLSRLTEVCRRIDNEPFDGDEARASFDAQYARGEIDSSLRAFFREHTALCVVVSEQLPSRDWYALGRAAGDPVLLLMEEPEALQALRFDGHYDPDEAMRALVIAAATTLDPIVLRTISFWAFDEDGITTDEERIRFFAWEQLICRANSACDDRVARAILERDTFGWEQEAILEEARALQLLIRAGRLPEHDLRTMASAKP